MTIDFENEYGTLPLPEPEELAGRVIACALDYMNCPYEARVGLLLTDDEEIQRLNSEHRGIDRATDVLSFPMVEYERPGDFSILEKETVDCFDPGNWFWEILCCRWIM